MKKWLATVALGTLLVAGFLFAQDSVPTDYADGEPSILSVGHPSFEL
ncbi:hypothetical protein ACFSMW_19405 [Virgibacillus halophilus]|uniref:Uncharacterized protein n=1 Tax=Tigheibacillus halophilus TaxID=361280 RepID=A0ABU5C8T9_9BACI|nr:hypothetical protein [Virgibacillus halophilus]